MHKLHTMEENTIPSGADDQLKPQEIENQPIEDQKSSEQVDETIEPIKDESTEQSSEEIIETKDTQEEEKKNNDLNEIDLSGL